jgi:hypothetical protein
LCFAMKGEEATKKGVMACRVDYFEAFK